MTAPAPARRFPFRFAGSYRVPALAIGITPATAWVEVAGGGLVVRFGLWRLRTPLTNVAGAERTGGFAWWKTAGPPRLSVSDRGVSFATNGEAAVCVRFHEPVAVLAPRRLLAHPGATLTVTDPPALAALVDPAR